MNDPLIQAFAKDYMGKVYYFCLKKTGDPHEADDLAADIALNIVAALKKPAAPQNFPAWVWQIARNRYAAWSAAKHRRSAFHADADPDGVADGCLTEDDLTSREDMALLRRELAFISREYREILVAYYIGGEKVQDIADRLSLPKGTVTSKLFRSRNLLKEGMNMARTFGVRSYKPEQVTFAASGNQPSGLPWRAVERQLPKNILLQADNNPSTLEELAMETGIALPYMEEEVQLLKDADLLKQVGSKYVTNFFIADADCQVAVYEAQKRDSALRARMVDEIVEAAMPDIRKLNIMRNDMNDGDFKWLLDTMLIDEALYNWPDWGIIGVFKRPDGGNWGFIGYEAHDRIPEVTISGQDNNSCDTASFCIFSFWITPGLSGMRNGRMSSIASAWMADMIRNDRKLSSLTPAERPHWEYINGRFAHADGERLIPDIAIFGPGIENKMYDFMKRQPMYQELSRSVTALFDEVRDILKSYSSPVLHGQLNYYTSMMMCALRGMLINEEVAQGRLRLPEHPETSTVGIYLTVK